MKKLAIPMMIIAAVVAFYEQQNPHPRVYITAIAVVIFMYGIMRLSAKTPSKNENKQDDDVQ